MLDFAVTALGTYSSLIDFAGFQLLLDVGLEAPHPDSLSVDQSFYISTLDVPSLDAVLISSSTFLGSLNKLIEHPDFSAVIILTYPVYSHSRHFFESLPPLIRSCVHVSSFGEKINIGMASFTGVGNNSNDSLIVTPYPNGCSLGSALFTLNYGDYHVLLLSSVSLPSLPSPLPLPSSLHFLRPSRQFMPPLLPCLHLTFIDHLDDPADSLEGYISDIKTEIALCCKSQISAGKNVILATDVADTSSITSVISIIGSQIGPEVPFFIVGPTAPKIYSELSTYPQFFSQQFQDLAINNNPDNILIKAQMEFTTSSPVIPITITEKGEQVKQNGRRRLVMVADSFYDEIFQEMVRTPCVIIGGGVLGSEFDCDLIKRLGHYSVVFLDFRSQYHADSVVDFDREASEVEKGSSVVQYFYYPLLNFCGATEVFNLISPYLKANQSFLIASGSLTNYLPFSTTVGSDIKYKVLEQGESHRHPLSPVFYEKAFLDPQVLSLFQLEPLENDCLVGSFKGMINQADVTRRSAKGHVISVPDLSSSLGAPRLITGKATVRGVYNVLISNQISTDPDLIANTKQNDGVASIEFDYSSSKLGTGKVWINICEEFNSIEVLSDNFKLLNYFEDMVFKSLSNS
ncbi:hypothetical protein GEMRC1_006822 [Eukaryota sp. GEM-RC1]